MESRVLGDPLLHIVMGMRPIVIHDQVQIQSGRRSSVDPQESKIRQPKERSLRFGAISGDRIPSANRC